MSKINIPWKKYLRLKYILIPALILLFTFAGTVYLRENIQIVPEELLNTAITNTLGATSYQFQTRSTITVDGEDTVFSDIKGERANGDTFHVTGSMLGTEINVYQINNTTYRLDSITNKWIITENNSLLKESLLMAELNPLSNFYFKELISTAYLGQEKIGGRKMYKIECVPKINNKWLDGYFKELKYIIWINKREKTITKATVTALSKERESSSLTVEVELSNYNKDFKIEPPVMQK